MHTNIAKLWALFEAELFPLPSADRLFNFYRDSDLRVDLAEAPEIRRHNLFTYLDSLPAPPPLLLVGEAPGPWECRFSGIPFTGERQLCARALPFGGRRSSRDKPLLSTRLRAPFTSLSARAFWKAMLPHYPGFLAWNSVPLHPHHASDILSIRAPTSTEVFSFCPLLSSMVAILGPRKIVAIGRHAQRALREIGLDAAYVRHPSQGGAAKFEAAVAQLFAEPLKTGADYSKL